MDTAADFEDRRLIRAALRDLLKRKRGHISHSLPCKSLIKLPVKEGVLLILCSAPFRRSVSPVSPDKREQERGSRQQDLKEQLPSKGGGATAAKQRTATQSAFAEVPLRVMDHVWCFIQTTRQ